ncbi:MAG: RMD1 family protein [Acidiferrobacterales bacterium]|nr:RMD1 family protein [Acidiferrobacterales bacterium]
MDNNGIYALCFSDYFEFPQLQQHLLTSERCAAYRNALHVEWRQGDVFVFDYGVLVFWRLAAGEREAFLAKVAPFAKSALKNTLDDEFTFETGSEKSFIKNDHIHLQDDEILTRLAVSHGIAQSTKLAQFENRIQQTINDTVYIPENIARTGSAQLSGKELSRLRGRLYITKSDVMLNYDLLDVPDFFWEYPELDSLYSIVADYLEIRQRVEVLSKKLETIHELFDMMADEQKHRHSSMLEWIIIWLIAIEIVIFLVHDIFKIF